MNILVTGAGGQLGHEFQCIAKHYSDYTFYFTTRADLDIQDQKAIHDYCTLNQINFIINCAAYTAVDQAENDRDSAFAINEKAVSSLAIVAQDLGILLIHYSTDYVYHLDIADPLSESDTCQPKGIYGQSKLAGERAIVQSEVDHVIIRVSWLYSSFKNNFVKTMLRLGATKNEISVVSDQLGSPTYARDLAKDTMTIIGQLIARKIHPRSTYNYSNLGTTRWNEFAQEIFNLKKMNCQVHPISTLNFGAKAPRPLWSVMSKEKIIADFNLFLRPWQESLQECLEELDGMA
jgi:dTDP-4-dehydrorhamnose reductase